MEKTLFLEHRLPVAMKTQISNSSFLSLHIFTPQCNHARYKIAIILIF